ncbi:phage holin family protein [Desertibacillus haloalkaliphilus]|nr:phage holin family protein [Desertibacillus haloalkaliphilus]
MSELVNHIIEEAYILIPVLLVLGTMLKKTPNIKDWLIPYIVLFIGVGFSIALLGFNVDAVIQGVIVAGVSVFGHQMLKQYKKKDDDHD